MSTTIQFLTFYFKCSLLLNHTSDHSQILIINYSFNKLPPYEIWFESVAFIWKSNFAYSPFHSLFQYFLTDFVQNQLVSRECQYTSPRKILSQLDASFSWNCEWYFPHTYVHTYIHTYIRTDIIKILLFLDFLDLKESKKHKNSICEIFDEYHALFSLRSIKQKQMKM